MKQIGKAVAVYGAGGHTGRFVVDEALSRGLTVVAIGRDASRLPAGVQGRVAAVDDAGALDEALKGCGVVINCAGPFLDTAAPVIEAALRMRCGYIDVAAEQASARAVFEDFDARARAAGVAVIPAAGFYGGLADLLASALAFGGPVSELGVAIALDHWWPTEGTRKTGERNQVPRVVLQDGQLVRMPTPAAQQAWVFGSGHGEQAVVELPFSEVITIARHLDVKNLRSWLTLSSLQEIRDTATPPPTASDAQGRSAQRFEMVVQAGDRKAIARGQDIYALSAPLVVEAAERMLQPSFKLSGALALGEAFEAKDFLQSLKDVELQLPG
ncbi:hypothetical protein ASD88_19360 [Pelomonas sp. Root662]|nr:hypothetical protein ASC81_15200 [Pelomonas sp. Root405]KRA70268.1 hypothetical protein ASD88_19360 [Pelomonas sp. Root662]